MSNISFIDRHSGARIADGALEKLQAFAEELGLSVAQEGRWMYQTDGTSLTLKVKFVTGGEEGKADVARKDFERKAFFYGLSTEHYGLVLTISGKRYKISKINTKAHKYPLECDALVGERGIRLSRSYIDRIKKGERSF